MVGGVGVELSCMCVAIDSYRCWRFWKSSLAVDLLSKRGRELSADARALAVSKSTLSQIMGMFEVLRSDLFCSLSTIPPPRSKMPE